MQAVATAMRCARARTGKPGRRPAVPLRSLIGAAPVAHRAFDDALHRIWLDGFCAGVATLAPGRVKLCARCGEPFVAGSPRDVYCGARCRNTMVKRRYRALLRARQLDMRLAG